MKFKYKARKKTGELQTGVLEGESERAVRKKAEDEGLKIIYLKEGDEKKGISLDFLNNIFHVPALEVITFVHLLSVMVKSGLSLSKALGALSRQTKNKKFSTVIADVNLSVSKGNTFADSLAKHPDIFDELFINMVRVGEISGTLESILFLLSDQMKKDYELKSKVKGAMIYPAVILTVMIGVGVVVMIYVMPKLTAIFTAANVELPATTRFLMAISNLLVNYGVYIFVIAVILGVVLKNLATGRGVAVADKIILKSPIFGEIAKKINVARFARTTSSLIKGGVSISTALKTVSKTLSNYYYKKSIYLASEKIEKGESLKDILSGFPDLYTPLVIQMIEVGEETGSLDDIMMDLAEFYEGEINETTKNLSTIIEPVLMVVMGIAVGFFAISMIQPMYSIGDTIK